MPNRAQDPVGQLLRAALALLLASGALRPAPAAGQGSFVNWESAHVSPLALTPNRQRLLAVNTADARLEVYDTTGFPQKIAAIPVGLDPISVRVRTDTEAWVVNTISDTVSVVDLTTENVVATLDTDDEPADVEFAGTPQRAFVSCAQTRTLLVFDPADLAAPPVRIALEAEEPRAMTRSADGSTLYVAAFLSGNGTTVLGGGMTIPGAFPPTTVAAPTGPHGGANPPPNDGAAFLPPLDPANPPPPAVSLIVRRSAAGAWLDDSGGDWTSFVSGPEAPLSGRPVGWQLLDHDLVSVDANTLAVTYSGGLMHQCSHLAIHPPSGAVSVVGSDSRNEVRFEPNVRGVFNRMLLAAWSPLSGGVIDIFDLNPHLDYLTAQVPQSMRDLSIGDPRAIVWQPDGSRAFIAGKGSNHVIAVAPDGTRIGAPVEVAEGPTGLALDPVAGRLYVLSHFAATLTVLDTSPFSVDGILPFHDSTPSAIQTGRKHLYDTHRTSGLGHLACASCHIDARMDQLAWDLGHPAGAMRPFDQYCLDGCDDWHPMKGPMTTQTLQDIIGKEPFHWRGDRRGIEEFNGAFVSLLGDDTALTAGEMQQFEDFLATITYPPNPHRNFDNTLPAALPLDGHHSTGLFTPAGTPLPVGNAQSGLDLFRSGFLVGANSCVLCHTLPSGVGTELDVTAGMTPVPVGPDGEHHHALTGSDGVTNISIKVPQLRNAYKKVGADLTQPTNLVGFGYLHDGSVDSLARFISQPFFGPSSDQEIADLVAFVLSFSGSDLPMGSTVDFFEPLGPTSQDTHAAVGEQRTVTAGNRRDPALVQRLADMQALADAGAVGWIAHGIRSGEARGHAYVAGMWQSDRTGEPTLSTDALHLGVAAGSEITFTVVPAGTEIRLGLDRDEDGFFDQDELDACSFPTNPAVTPLGTDCGDPDFIRGDSNGDGAFDIGDPVRALGVLFQGAGQLLCVDASDVNDDGVVTIADPISALGALFGFGNPPAAPFPSCGVDPTADFSDCVFYVPCP